MNYRQNLIVSLFFLVSIFAKASHIVINESYRHNSLICKSFIINGNCSTKKVEAEKGTVNGSMYAASIVMTNWLEVSGSLNNCKSLQCKSFIIHSDCNTNQVEAGQGTVDGSMYAASIVMKAWLKVGGSLNNSKSLQCKSFTINGNCNANQIEAEKGTVIGSMDAASIVMKAWLEVGGSLNNCKSLQCKSFTIHSDCNTNQIEAEQGTVNGSMYAASIAMTNWLTVNGSLNNCKSLQCKSFIINGNCNTNEVKAEQGTVNGSMTITKKALFDRQLSVGSALTCINLVNNGSTFIGHIIKAQNSSFQNIFIQNKNNRYSHNTVSINGGRINNFSFYPVSLFIAFFKMIWHYFFGSPNNGVIIEDCGNATTGPSTNNITIQNNGNNVVIRNGNNINIQNNGDNVIVHNGNVTVEVNHKEIVQNKEGEVSEFENCTIQAISVDKNNKNGNPKQIIQLKNTTVHGNIVFAEDTVGEVWLYTDSKIFGQVVNGRFVNK